MHYKKDGTLDMRFKSSKQAAAGSGLLSLLGIAFDVVEGIVGLCECFTGSESSQDQVNIDQPRESQFYIIDGKVKSDCPAVKNGDVKFTASGAIDPKSKAIKSGELRLLGNGFVDPECEAYKNQEYVYQRKIFAQEIRDKNKLRAFMHTTLMIQKNEKLNASQIMPLETNHCVLFLRELCTIRKNNYRNMCFLTPCTFNIQMVS